MIATPNWNTQQREALTKVGAWLRDPNAPQIFRLFGFAGTGKTTLAQHLAAQENGLVLFAAYTGKAASVLRDKGCLNATTMHALMYRVHGQDTAEFHRLSAVLDGLALNDPYRQEVKAELAIEKKKMSKPKFSLNEESVVRDCALLVLDEVSMVDKKLAQDALSFNRKILVLGDPGQLPPIQGLGYFTDAKPDVMLTDIHRQAAENPIIRWATMARKGLAIPHGTDGNVRKCTRAKVDDYWLATQAGQILCGKNATRQQLNKRVRKVLGFHMPYPEHNDTLVVLRNNHRLGILNGVICNAAMDASTDLDGYPPDVIGLNLRYEDRILYDLLVDGNPFLNQDPDTLRNDLVLLDFGYAITVHKSQGSEWPTVTLYDDGFGKIDADLRKRWLYTAITRARSDLHIITAS